MSKNVKVRLIKYGVSIGIGLLLAYGYIALREFSPAPLVEKYRMLCDAFTIPGVVLLMSGALMSVANAGALEGVGYVLSQGFGMLIPGKGLGTETYEEYIERKREKRVKGYGFLYISGALFLAVALVFIILFYSIYNK